LLFTEAPFGMIYDGVWGYNGILSGGAVGGFFLVLTCHSFWLAMLNILFTVLIQQVLVLALTPVSSKCCKNVKSFTFGGVCGINSLSIYSWDSQYSLSHLS